MNKVTRRAALSALPAVGIAALSSIEAEASDSPIMVLFRQWEALYRQSWDDGSSGDDADECFDQMADLEKQMLAMTVTDARDFAAKLIVYTMYGTASLVSDSGIPLLDEAQTLVGGCAMKYHAPPWWHSDTMVHG